MNDIERMMSNLPHLKHLELIANSNNDVADGHRWQIKVKSLVTFKFMFNLLVELKSQDLHSFRTPFWLEEKRWFVAYTHKRLVSVPHFIATETDEDFRLPLDSTVPDNIIFYEHIDTLQLREIPDNDHHYFAHVQTLTVSSPILPYTIEKIVHLTQIQHLNLYLSLENFPVMLLINEMPNLRQISIGYEVKIFLKQVHGGTIEKIHALQIGNSFMNVDDYDIEQLWTVFSNIKDLRVDHTCSTTQIFDFLDRFKHLSSASFRYAPWSIDDVDMQQGRLEIQSELDRVRSLQRLNYTYRFDRSSVHIWI
jgi:hypothetical protein